MFEKMLKFFIENYKINYLLFFLLFAAGIYSYTQIPKEISPVIDPDFVTIRGKYSGASVNMLNSMAVQEIEDETKNIEGVKAVSSVISPGRFDIELELKKGADKTKVVEETRDAIAKIKSNLPSDMDEPTIRGSARLKRLMHVALLSSKITNAQLRDFAKSFRSKLLSVQDVSEVTIYGDAERFYEILIDEKKINAYHISQKDILDTLSELSYIYPLGQIEDKTEQYYISTSNGKKLAKDLADTILNINGRTIALKDIAHIQKRYEDSTTLASMNGQNSITLAISQDAKGDAIEIAQNINTLIATMHVKDINFDIRRDQSILIKGQLNVVISNIILAAILITLLASVLINMRMAFIIFLGIPTSFVMASIYFYLTGYSININSLIGVLIAIGVIVDDAIVVSENIQQYIEKGYPPREAAFLGAKEMASPVFLAALTTLFSFIPLLMITGKLGEIVQLIPIAFSALIFASLIESFVFLPIHAAHILTPKSKTLSWDKANLFYLNTLKLIVKYQKTFLLIFFIIVPLLIYSGVKNAKFQMFQPFDAAAINITFKAKNTTTLEESLQIVQTIEKDLLAKRDSFFVKNVSSTAGYRRSATDFREAYPYVGYITVELYKKKPSNFMDKYITPYLSFYYDDKDMKRDISSQKISKDIRDWLETQNYREKFSLNDLMVVEKGMGHVKADIRIGIVSDDYKKAIKAIAAIESDFAKIKGMKYFGNNVKMGTDEIKIKINTYGEKLGITEEYLGSYLSDLYLSKKVGVIFDEKELLEVKMKSLNKDDFQNFKRLQIPLKDGTFVSLSDICEFQNIKSLEMLVKDDGEVNFYIFANLDTSVVTSSEVLEKIDPTLRALKKDGIKLKFKGEREQKQALQSDMLVASVLAIVLIFMSILYLFNSLRETLIVMSVIPFSFLGVFIGHTIMGLNISLPSLVGALGLSGVIVNNGIIMMSTLKTAEHKDDIFSLAARRFRPIIITTVTTLIGLSSLIFFASAESVTFQPLAVTIGYGLLWGTVLNLFYLPALYNLVHSYRKDKVIEKY